MVEALAGPRGVSRLTACEELCRFQPPDPVPLPSPSLLNKETEGEGCRARTYKCLSECLETTNIHRLPIMWSQGPSLYAI